MKDLLLLLVLNELAIVGIWTLTCPDQLLGGAGKAMDIALPRWLSKPFYACIPCMGSFWGTVIFWYTHNASLENLITWPFYCLALCGLGKLLTSVIQISPE